MTLLDLPISQDRSPRMAQTSEGPANRAGAHPHQLPSFGTVSDGLAKLQQKQSSPHISNGLPSTVLRCPTPREGDGVPQSTRDWLGHGPVSPGQASFEGTRQDSGPLSSLDSLATSPPAASKKNGIQPMTIPASITSHPLFAHHASPSAGNSDAEGSDANTASDFFHPGLPRVNTSDSYFSEPVYGTSPSSPQNIAVGSQTAGASLILPGAAVTPPPASDADGEVDEDQPLSPASAFLSSFGGVSRSTSLKVPGPHDARRGITVAGSSIGDHHPVLASFNRASSLSPVNMQSLGSMLGSSYTPSDASVTSSSAGEDSAGAQILGYTLGKVVGRGGFSTVRLATKEGSAERFVCRIIKRDDLSDTSGSLENFEKELSLWQSLPRHPRILPLLEMHRTDYATYIISPYMPGGSLLDVLKRDRGSEVTARKYFPGVVAAVQALHQGYPGFEEGHLLHGDLKLDNFLLGADGTVVVCDFGLTQRLKSGESPVERVKRGESKEASPVDRNRTPREPSASRSRSRPRGPSPFPTADQLPTFSFLQHPRPHIPSHLAPHHHDPSPHRTPHHGHYRHVTTGHITPAKTFPSASLPYAPPELLSPAPSGPSLAQDIWALGIILHALLTSRLPFTDAFDPRLTLKIIRGDYAMPDVGAEWQECLRGCLEHDKRKRWDIKRLSESDAVTGWQRVRTRSRSRSRVREPQPSTGAYGEYRNSLYVEDRGRRSRSRSNASRTQGGAEPSPSREPWTNMPVTAPGARPSRSRSSGRDERTVRQDHAAQVDAPPTPEHRGRHRARGGEPHGPPHAPSAAYSTSHDRGASILFEEEVGVSARQANPITELSMRFERSVSAGKTAQVRDDGSVPPPRTGRSRSRQPVELQMESLGSPPGQSEVGESRNRTRSRSRGRTARPKPL